MSGASPASSSLPEHGVAHSLAEQLAAQGPAAVERWLSELGAADYVRLIHDWRFWGRPSQQAPLGDWWAWVILTGRGWGKNRTAREWYRDEVERRPGGTGFLAARTFSDIRDTLLYHPESGFMVDQRPWNPCEYRASLRALVWRNGFTARFYTSEKPDQGRGPQHELGLGDEFATWKQDKDESGNTLLENLLKGNRQKRRLQGGGVLEPRMCLISTPRPIKAVTDFVEQAKTDTRIRVTRGTMWENASNLPVIFLEMMRKRYKGTRAGRQELEGEILEAVEGALWNLERMIDAHRRPEPPAREQLRRIVVGVDPAVSKLESSNRTGIVVDALGHDRHLYALANRSCVASPNTWAQRVVDSYHEHGADAVVAEVNNGGDLVESNVHTVDPDVRVIKVTATRGKHKRAEPVASLYEQGRAHHCGEPGQWAAMEAQMCAMTPDGYEGDGSPDDLDAHVWAVSQLLELDAQPAQRYGVW